MAARILRCGDALALALLLAGWLLRFTIRDAWLPAAVIFYATPWPVLAALGAWLAWRGRSFRGRKIAALGLAAAALAAWFSTSWKFAAPSTARADLRVVQWNVARPVKRLPAIVARLRALDADVINVAEALPEDHATVARWPAEFPGYEAVFSAGELLCLVRGEVQRRESGWLGPSSYFTALDVVVKGRALTILQVDLIATPWRSRRAPLARLADIVATKTDRPLVVLGDFNTPRESAQLAPLRAQLTHAWEAAGHGCAETWPMPAPVLSLDQVWLGGGLRALRCAHGVSALSDHRPVIVDLAWP